MAAGTVIFWLFPGPVMQMFNATPDMYGIGIPALRIISIGFLPSAVGMILSGIFEALGNGGKSLAVSLIRQLILIIPLSILFGITFKMGLTGVWITFPISEFTAAVVALYFYRRMKRRL